MTFIGLVENFEKIYNAINLTLLALSNPYQKMLCIINYTTSAVYV